MTADERRIVDRETLAAALHEALVNCMRPAALSRGVCGPGGRSFEDMHLHAADAILAALSPAASADLSHTWAGHIDCDPAACTVASLARGAAASADDGAGLAAVEAVVRYQRSDGPKMCICCPGEPTHVFNRHLVTPDGEYIAGTGGGWVFDALRRIPEGTRVRLALSQLDKENAT